MGALRGFGCAWLPLACAVLVGAGAPLRAEFLTVSADAHIEGNAPSSNFGTNEVLSLANTTVGGNKAYLLFDASGWGTTNIGRVESLRVVWASGTNITRSMAFSLITGTDANDWTETGITWNNAPGNNVSGTSRGFAAYPGQTVTSLGGIQYAAGSPRELVIPFGAGSAEGHALLAALNTGDRKATIGVSYNSSQVASVALHARESEGGIHAATLELAVTAEPVPPLTDQQLFDRLNLHHPGLEAVRAAVTSNDLGAAKTELARYYRERTGLFHYIDAHDPARSVSDPAGRISAAQPLVNRTGDYDAQYWNGDEFDWLQAQMRYKERMYFFSTFGEAAAVEEGDDIAQALVHLMRSFAWQYHSPANRSGGMWATMNVGIRMRSGWPTAFQCLLQSPAFTDEDIILFLKTVWDQTDYIYRNPSDTSNWLTFEMAGLYTSGVVYPEFLDAQEWRRFACQTAMDDIDRGWLPDGMSIEKSPSYGQFFSNYYVMYSLALFVGRLAEFDFHTFPARTEHLFEAYLKLMSPDRLTPVLNDGGTADVIGILNRGLEYFPQREDFRWITSQGQQGARPGFTSVAFPYAGYLVARSGWETDANYLLCDAGPVGYRHAHQDKLNVVMWAYGRQVLFDSPQPGATEDWTHLNYFRDTFSHSTGLVDNRPQRRRWYNAPHPNQMPYQPLADFAFEITAEGAWAAGSYTGSYGRAGSIGNDSYPYKSGSNFYEDWGTPAAHFRQVAYAAPDVFVVQDWFVPNNAGVHTCEIRWQLDSTQVTLNGLAAQTMDAGQPNLAVIPLHTAGMQADAASAQWSPEVMGWKLTGDTVQPATTLRHVRTGPGTQGFLTWLHPLRKGSSLDGLTFDEQGGVMALHRGDGRVFSLEPAEHPGAALRLKDLGFAAHVLPVAMDAHIDGQLPDVNFGAADVLRVGQTSQGGQKAYLLFDASGLGAREIERVGPLRVFYSGNQTRTLWFGLLTGTGANDWTEDGITWTNAPANNVTGTSREFVAYPGQTVTPLGTLQGTSAGQELALTFAPGSPEEQALLAALNTGARKATIGVRYNSSQSSIVGIYAWERAAGAFIPTLSLGLKPVAPSVHGLGMVEGRPRLELDGPAAALYTIMVSTNLVEWSDLETLVVARPPIQWSDASNTADVCRFYRLRVR